MNTEKLLADIRQAVQADPVGPTAELLNRAFAALGEQAQPAADCGLEVVAWRIGLPNGAGCKVYEQHQPWAYERYGRPPFVTYEVQDLCRLSDATTVIDQLREELAKAHEYGYQYRQERNKANQELAALKGPVQDEYGYANENKLLRAKLSALKSAPAVMPEQDGVTDAACRKLLFAFALECNAIGLTCAAENLFRGMKEATSVILNRSNT